MVSIANNGSMERDRMVRSCLATICELGKSLRQNKKASNSYLFHYILHMFSVMVIYFDI